MQAGSLQHAAKSVPSPDRAAVPLVLITTKNREEDTQPAGAINA